MNTQAAEFLQNYASYYWAICVEEHKALGTDVQDIFDDIVVCKRLTADELEIAVNRLRERVPTLGFSQAQGHIFRVLGYRSKGVAFVVRRTYTKLHNTPVLTHPNMWHEFLNVYHNDSVFGSPDYSKDEIALHYIEFVFEPRLRGLLSADDIPEDLLDAYFTMLNISQQKTMSEPMARTLAEQLEHELDHRVRHHTAMNMVAIALGYKTWPLMLAAVEHDSVQNLRIPNRFGSTVATVH